MNRDFLTSAFNKLRSALWGGPPPDDETEDALQEAFCRLWTLNRDFPDSGRAEGALKVAARNIRIDAYRRKISHPHSPIEDTSPEEEILRTYPEEPEDYLTERYRQIETIARDALSARDREILFLREKYGWDFSELAQKFEISESNVRMIISRSRKRLLQLYRTGFSNDN